MCGEREVINFLLIINCTFCMINTTDITGMVSSWRLKVVIKLSEN